MDEQAEFLDINCGRELDRIWHGHELPIDHDTGSTVTFEDLKPLFSDPCFSLHHAAGT